MKGERRAETGAPYAVSQDLVGIPAGPDGARPSRAEYREALMGAQ